MSHSTFILNPGAISEKSSSLCYNPPMEAGSAKTTLTNRIHSALAHSYFFYLFFLLVGIALDIFFPFRIFRGTPLLALGTALLIFGSVLILWAQHTTRNLHKKENLEKEDFLCGPYCYTRTPTHWGIFILALGFGLVINAFFVVVTTALSFLLGKVIFIKRYEKALVKKYGDSYLEYKKEVKL
jgi:protein-S-isoprenylcysteine O-methyltransferase Ste14